MMFTPAYKLTLGRQLVDTTDKPRASTVVDLMVAVDMDTPADSFTLTLGNVGSFKPAREDEAKIELGYADNGGLIQVMAGTVLTHEPGLTAVRVIGHSSAAILLRTFIDKTYEAKTAGAIVRDLAVQAGVTVARAEDGTLFPAYVIDGRKSVYHHMHDLADLCGFDLYLNSDNALVFEKFTGGKAVHVFEYAKHILELDMLETPPKAGQVQAFGESRAGRSGDESWAWLTKDFSGSKGVSGTGKPVGLLEKSALRTRDAAATAAEAAFTNIQRQALRGRLLSVGRPEVKLGDAIRLRGMTDEALNTYFQVRSVTHHITKLGGFTTLIGFRAFKV